MSRISAGLAVLSPSIRTAFEIPDLAWNEPVFGYLISKKENRPWLHQCDRGPKLVPQTLSANGRSHLPIMLTETYRSCCNVFARTRISKGAESPEEYSSGSYEQSGRTPDLAPLQPPEQGWWWHPSSDCWR